MLLWAINSIIAFKTPSNTNRVNIWFNLIVKVATKGFVVLNALVGHKERQKKVDKTEPLACG